VARGDGAAQVSDVEVGETPWGAVRKPRRDDEFEFVPDRIDARGHVLGTFDGYRVRARKVPLGARARVRVQKRRRDLVEVHALEILERGPHAVEPHCPHVKSCGGCSFQEVDYSVQLRAKEELLERELGALDADASFELREIVGCEDPFAYRNKMDFTFANRRWVEEDEDEDAPEDFALGLHAPGRYEKVLDVHHCAIHFPEADAILGAARDLARELELSPWDLHEHTGLLRHLVVRKGTATGEIMIYLVTSPGEREAVDEYVRRLVAARPEVTTVIHGETDRLSTVAQAGEQRVLHGSGVIRDELDGLSFEISPESFFQTNTLQAERLLRAVCEEAAPRGSEVVHDLYCGGGTLTLGLARAAGSVWGFEVVPSAVADARRNAEHNGLADVRFIEGDVVETLASCGAPKADVWVVDPPRAGLHSRVLEAILQERPRRVVYVSCNPAAAVRDIAGLGHHYRLGRARPFDLFPHTPHLECVFTLHRVEGASGLCPTCNHVRRVDTESSSFWLCGKSREDPAFSKYPPQPVVACPGWSR